MCVRDRQIYRPRPRCVTFCELFVGFVRKNACLSIYRHLYRSRSRNIVVSYLYSRRPNQDWLHQCSCIIGIVRIYLSTGVYHWFFHSYRFVHGDSDLRSNHVHPLVADCPLDSVECTKHQLSNNWCRWYPSFFLLYIRLYVLSLLLLSLLRGCVSIISRCTL